MVGENAVAGSGGVDLFTELHVAWHSPIHHKNISFDSQE